ncbi:MAG: VCBS repeat-containing protein [Phycisphaerae bacterium]|nr:VCBS repeat-containing protein [Phycisphaerae bacterium]
MKARLSTTSGLLGASLLAIGPALMFLSGCSVNFAPGGGDGQGGTLVVGRTFGDFFAIQVDPQSEDSSGPQFVVADDLDNDGLIDLVSAWNQSEPVQVHFQRRNARNELAFETVTIAGSVPVVSVAGLAVADFDADGHLDIAVLIKQSLLDAPGCLDNASPDDATLSGVIILYMGPDNPDLANRALAWREIPVGVSRLAGAGNAAGAPEEGGYTQLSVGDIDVDGDMDLITAWNGGCGGPEIVVFQNQGPARVRDGTWVAQTIPDSLESTRGSRIKTATIADIDSDGDLDIVATFPDATTANVRWYRNPARDVVDDYHISDGTWQTGAVGHVKPRAGFDELGSADVATVSDIDGDGLVDVVVRSSGGGVIQWFKRPEAPTTAPLRQLPWQVYTIAEYTDRTPESIAVGDLDGDGQVELAASAEGGLSLFNATTGDGIYEQWIETLLVDDSPADQNAPPPDVTDPNIEPGQDTLVVTTLMNSILIVDLDQDGRNDMIVPFDRSGLSGLSSDLIVWFRNTR